MSGLIGIECLVSPRNEVGLDLIQLDLQLVLLVKKLVL